MTIAAIILAAGASTRMGQPKQLLPINGRPLLIHTLEVVEQASLEPIIVVLGANHHEHHDLVARHSTAAIVFNPHWQNGMGSSLKAGLNNLLKYDQVANAVMMLVCDQPGITPAHLRNLIKQYQLSNTPIVASWYSGAAGVPALFDKTLFPELLNLNDAHGAQKVIRHHTNQLTTVDFPEGVIDIDTPQDYENYVKTKKPSAG
jgi:molybdenum cofactor cytidylyltransferase